MKKIKEFLSKITKNHVLHFVAGVILTITTFGVISLCMHSSYRGVITTIILVLTTAVFKELYDKFYKTKPFVLADVLCTILGAILASVLLFIIMV